MSVVLAGLLLALIARPLAILGEWSASIVQEVNHTGMPARADSLLLWLIRLQGVGLSAIGLALLAS